MTDDEIEYYENGCCTEGDCNLGRRAFADEIRHLRAENAEIRKWLDGSRLMIAELQKEIDRYRTPHLDGVTFEPRPDEVSR